MPTTRAEHLPPSAPASIHAILAQFRDDARSNRDLGDRFERLMKRYFELDPMYTERFAKVYMWQDWPRRGAFGDTGIDLVAATDRHSVHFETKLLSNRRRRADWRLDLIPSKQCQR